MTENTLPKRKPNRLPEFEYGAGAYFVTICTQNRKNLFWAPLSKESLERNVGAAVQPFTASALHDRESDIIRPSLSDCGKVVERAILSISEHYPNVTVDHYVVMANHVHLILQITETNGRIISAPTLSTVIGMMKRSVTKQMGRPVWQKSFHIYLKKHKPP